MRTTILSLCFSFICIIVSAQPKTEGDSSSDSSAVTVIDSAELYGFIPQRPIKVGGGPREQRQYLERLRDVKGKKVTYERLYSCCPYDTDSPSAFMGGGMLDVYEITYRDSENQKQKIKVFITFYDFEKPRAVKGFTLED